MTESETIEFLKGLFPTWELLPRTEKQWADIYIFGKDKHRVSVWAGNLPSTPNLNRDLVLLIEDMASQQFLVKAELRIDHHTNHGPTEDPGCLVVHSNMISATRGNARICVVSKGRRGWAGYNVIKVMAKYKGAGWRVVQAYYPNGNARTTKIPPEVMALFDEVAARCENEDSAKLPKAREFTGQDFEVQKSGAIARRNCLSQIKITGMGHLLPSGAFRHEVANPSSTHLWFLAECEDRGFQFLHVAYNGDTWYELAGRERPRIKEVETETELTPVDKTFLDKAVELWLQKNID